MASRQHTHIRTERHLRLCIVGVTLSLAGISGCSRQAGVLSLTQPAEASRGLPFNETSKESGISPTQAFAPSTVPAGTQIIVRLTYPVSSDQARIGDSFEAVLDQPILVNGLKVMRQGAPVQGRVASAKPSDPPNHAGYLRLTLSSINDQRMMLAVHTSSIFAKGSSRANQSVTLDEPRSRNDGNAEFSTVQRLTFRLLAPVSTAH